jgi:hypothetical protein
MPSWSTRLNKEKVEGVLGAVTHDPNRAKTPCKPPTVNAVKRRKERPGVLQVEEVKGRYDEQRSSCADGASTFPNGVLPRS